MPEQILPDVWGAFARGEQLGGRLGAGMRNRRQQDAYGQAWAQDGWRGVQQSAAREGDLDTLGAAEDRQHTNQTRALEWFRANAPVARNVLRAARAMQDPARRQQFLSQQRQRFVDMGFAEPQVDEGIAALTNPETADEAFAQFDQAFAQYEQPDWDIATVLNPQTGQTERRAVSIGADGTIQQGPNALPAGQGGHVGSPEEVAAAGFRPGTVVWFAPGEPPRPLQQPLAPRRGGGGAGAPTLPDGFEWE